MLNCSDFGFMKSQCLDIDFTKSKSLDIDFLEQQQMQLYPTVPYGVYRALEL